MYGCIKQKGSSLQTLNPGVAVGGGGGPLKIRNMVGI